MRFSLPIMAAIIGLASADFDLYIGQDNAYPGVQIDTFFVFGGEPDCNQVNSAETNDARDDVSGNKRGVRCEGRGCGVPYDPLKIDLIEMHFSNNPLLHFTIYKGSGKMMGLDGKVYGQCSVFTGDTFSCPNFNGLKSGVRIFRCKCQWSAADINRAD